MSQESRVPHTHRQSLIHLFLRLSQIAGCVERPCISIQRLHILPPAARFDLRYPQRFGGVRSAIRL